MTRRWRRLLTLRPGELFLLTCAFVWLIVAEVALRLVGLRRLMAGATPTAELSFSSEHLRRAANYSYWLDLAARHHFVRAHCLQRSLALHLWLRLEGVPNDLRIGVRKQDGVLAAHAWVEMDGYIVNDEATSVVAFTPFGRHALRSAARATRAGSRERSGLPVSAGRGSRT